MTIIAMCATCHAETGERTRAVTVCLVCEESVCDAHYTVAKRDDGSTYDLCTDCTRSTFARPARVEPVSYPATIGSTKSLAQEAKAARRLSKRP